MKGGNILIIEDELSIASLLQTNFEIEGYCCKVCHTLKEAEATLAAHSQDIDVVILDVLLPDGNGVEYCQKLKRNHPDIPVLILSALGESADRIKGLRSGAADYLGKPFDLEELLLRVSLLFAKITNRIQPTDSIIHIGEATINLDTYIAVSPRGQTKLTAREKDLLYYLYQNRGKVVSREKILEKVWQYDVFPTSRTIDNYIVKLRLLVESDPNDPVMLTTIRGVGYKLESES